MKFLVALRPEETLKNPVLVGFEPTTFRYLAQHYNHLATCSLGSSLFSKFVNSQWEKLTWEIRAHYVILDTQLLTKHTFFKGNIPCTVVSPTKFSYWLLTNSENKFDRVIWTVRNSISQDTRGWVVRKLD